MKDGAKKPRYVSLDGHDVFSIDLETVLELFEK